MPAPGIVAHRGASHDAPENTLQAFELAWQQGADAIEGDFHLTGDGIIVCHHDAELKTAEGQWKRIRESSAQDLALPRLSDVINTIPAGKHIFIEIKCGPEILPKLLDEIGGSGMAPDQFIVISFNASVISKLKELNPGIEAIWLVQFRRRDLRRKPSTGQILETLQTIHADGLGTNPSRHVTRHLVEAIKKAGFEYHVWSLDNPAEARKLVRWGVASITTNKPGIMRQAFAD